MINNNINFNHINNLNSDDNLNYQSQEIKINKDQRNNNKNEFNNLNPRVDPNQGLVNVNINQNEIPNPLSQIPTLAYHN